MRPNQALTAAAAIGRAERWVLRAGVLLLPLAHTWDTYDGYVLPKLLLARAVVVVLALLLGLRMVIGGRLAIRRTPLDWPLAAFVASAALSTAFAFNLNVAVFGTYARYDGLLTTVTYAALFWLAVQVMDTHEEARTVLRWLLAGGYLAALVAIVQVAHDSLTQGMFVAAYGTLGHKNVLGGFLAMLLPIAAFELAQARSWTATMLSANAFAAIAVALVLTFSRSAWIAAALAAALAAVAIARSDLVRVSLLRVGAGVMIAGVATALVLGAIVQAEGLTSLRGDLAAAGDRPVVWMDSLKVIASRPVLGYGPDNFGLVFPNFQSERLNQPWDKAHAETLQIAATQGVVGLAAYVALIVAFLIAFWRRRSSSLTVALFAGWIGYQAALQVNFTALASAFPYWVFAACAFELMGATHTRSVELAHRWHFAPVMAGGVAAAAFAAAVGIVMPFVADRDLMSAVIADYSGQRLAAEPQASNAVTLNQRESVYEVEVGNLAFERGDWRAAASAYREAASLGTYNPMVYRNLSLADREIGRMDEARIAAGQAYALDRFDPASRALLEQFTGSPA